MQFDELLGERKAKPCALQLGDFAGAHPPERIEYARDIAFRDAYARIRYRDLQPSPDHAGPDTDLASSGCELHRVGKQIQHDLLELSCIRHHVAQLVIDFQLDRDAVADSALSNDAEARR